MKIFARLAKSFEAEKPVDLPQLHGVIDAKAYPIVAQKGLAKNAFYGYGVVLIDSNGEQSPVFLFGKEPENVLEAAVNILPLFGTQPRKGSRTALLYRDSGVQAVVSEKTVVSQLAETKSIMETEAAKLSGELSVIGVRDSETFTALNVPGPPEFGRITLGEYDVD